MVNNKKTVLTKTLDKLKDKWPALKIGFGELDPLTFIPTPFNTLNTLSKHKNGAGIPRGKFGVIAGPQQTAKTTLMQQIIAYNQELDKNFIGLWTDAENCLDETWCQKLGVNLDNLIIHRPSEDCKSAEQLLQMGLDLLESKAIDIWVIDSIGALIPKSELEKTIEENAMLDIQRKLGLFFRKTNQVISPSKGDEFLGTAVVLIGQVYNVPTTTGVGLEEVRGGNAVKHWAYWRWKTRRGRQDEGGPKIKVTMPDGEIKDVPSGWAQHIKIDKTKVNDQERLEIVLQFVYGRGLDSTQAAISSLFSNNVFERKGGWYYHKLFPDGKIQGREEIVKVLQDNVDLRNTLINEMDNNLIKQNLEKIENEY